jgi:signal transduction histidine kinase/CheY-like chemotaxis protein
MPKDKKSIALVNSENRQSFFFTYLASQGILRGQSFPLISGNGEFVGVLNTYYRENKEFNNRESRMLDMLAHIAADAIERISMEKALQQSERHALELVEELKKTDRTKNDFISVLAHELRNPLAALDSGLILLSASRDKSETENAKQIMRRQIDYLRGLVEDLLDMTRIAQNKLKLDKTKIDIGVIAQQAADDIRPQYEAKNVRLTEHIAPTPLYLDADALRMNQILENLLNNSLKFTDQRGSVTLSVFQESGQAVLRVADDGIGIRSEILPNIFDAYTQADQAHMRISGGLGLGLSIVKNITKLHGGTVEAFSEGPGTGAVFTVRLPLDSYDAPESEENAGGKQECASLKILIIEDNQALADIQSILFQHMGYLVETAHDGFEGIRKAITGVPDVILCDIGMPGISGYEVAQTLRMNPVLAQTVFVALTGYASEEEKKKALESGFTMHLSKPVNTAALERVFDEVAAKKRRSKSDD